MWKTILSWLIALIIAFLVIKMVYVAIGAVLEFARFLILVVPMIIIAFPLYIIIRKKLLK